RRRAVVARRAARGLRDRGRRARDRRCGRRARDRARQRGDQGHQPHRVARDGTVPRMSLLGFGQPQTGIFHMAYVVQDIEAGMQRWTEQLGVGPWFLLEHFTGERATYRGAAAEADVALAMAYAGHMLVELIAPNDDKPSVYREAIEQRG